MSQQNNSLRFDIYERVHLGEDIASIQGLEEMELVPHIQIVTQDEQAILKGNLLLACTYDAEGAAGSQELEHRIPVEISLPLNRIHRVDDVTVEIENFDIELLSARSMNVTGVLTLQGLELPEQVNRSPWDEEEMTFVHQVQAEGSETSLGQEVQEIQETRRQEAPSAIGGDEADGVVGAQEIEEQAEAASRANETQRFATVSDQSSDQIAEAVTFAEERQPVEAIDESAPAASTTERVALTDLSDSTEIEASITDESTSEVKAENRDDVEESAAEASAEAIEAESVDDLASTEVADEKQELKIGFSAKKETGEVASASPLTSLFGKKGNAAPAENVESSVEEATSVARVEDNAQRVTESEEAEWKNLLSNPSAENEFRKVRICIVQKDETLANIADRYSLNPREIALYNQLGLDTEISAGQIIYIPGS